AILKPPKLVYHELPAVIRDAVAARAKRRPYRLPGPYELRIRFLSTDQLDGRWLDGAGAERIDGLTAVYRDDDLMRLLARAL
ncbi:MAG: aminopeptidase, partial [Alicyclobacillus sp.]|nr:aminopeptidase [Alicyclobacillus sp.]